MKLGSFNPCMRGIKIKRMSSFSCLTTKTRVTSRLILNQVRLQPVRVRFLTERMSLMRTKWISLMKKMRKMSLRTGFRIKLTKLTG